MELEESIRAMIPHRGERISGNGLTAMHCETCGYTHLSPLPNANDILQRYASDEFYSKIKPNYFVEEKADREWLDMVCYPLQMALINNAIKTDGRTLLDLGCGYGDFLSWASTQGWSVMGIEPAPILPVVGAWQSHLIENIEPDYEYGVVRAAWLLEHLRDPRAALKKIYRWLKVGGVFLAIVPNDFSVLQLAVSAPNNPNGIAANYWLHKTHVNYWNYQSFTQLLCSTGLSIVSTFGTYPMELFILSGENYIGNDEIGARVHARRKQMELNLIKSGNDGMAAFAQWGLSLAKMEWGRDMIFVARKDK